MTTADLVLQIQPRHRPSQQPGQELRLLLGVCGVCGILHQPPPVHCASAGSDLCRFRIRGRVPAGQPEVSF